MEPVILMADLDALTGRLDGASKELYRLQEEFASVEVEWEDLRDDLLVALLDEYEGGEAKEAAPKRRLPGEDVRNAIVAKRMRKENPVLYGNYRRLKAELDRKERLCKRIERQINGKQSVLSMLKTELQAAA